MPDTPRSTELSIVSQEFRDPALERKFLEHHWHERSHQNLTTTFLWILVVGVILILNHQNEWTLASTLFYTIQCLGYLAIRWLCHRPEYYNSYDVFLTLIITAMVMSGVNFHLIQANNSTAIALFITIPLMVTVAYHIRFYYTLFIVSIVTISFLWALEKAEIYDDFSRMVSYQIFVSAGIGLIIQRLINASRHHDYTYLLTEQRYNQKLTEAQRTSEKANQHKSLFLAQASHDIRTPMTGVLGLTRLLQKTELTSKQISLLKAIEASSNSLTNLMNQLLDLSRIEQGIFKLEEKVFNPQEMVEDVSNLLRPLAKDKDLIIQCDYTATTDFIIHADEGRLRQILINLVSNAIQYTEKGTIRIQLDIASDPSTSTHLALNVADSGAGIPKHEQDEIFDSFYQADTIRNSYGLGLGLSISRQLAKALNGDLTYHHSPQTQSTFRLQVPVTILKESHQKKTKPDINTHQLSGSILIVEDNRINSLVVKETLLSIEPTLKIDTAFDGEQAITLCQQHSYDLVLMDCMLPKINGFTALREIRELEFHRNTPIAAITASASPDDERRCHEAGFNYFITKPIKETELVHILTLHLSKNHPHPSTSHSHLHWNPVQCQQQMGGKRSTMVSAIKMALEDIPHQLDQISDQTLSDEMRREYAHRMKGTLKTLHSTLGISHLEAFENEVDLSSSSALEHLSCIQSEMNEFLDALQIWLSRQ